MLRRRPPEFAIAYRSALLGVDPLPRSGGVGVHAVRDTIAERQSVLPAAPLPSDGLRVAGRVEGVRGPLVLTFEPDTRPSNVMV